MPRLPDVPNVLRIKLGGLVAGQPYAAVQYARWAGSSVSSADLATAAGAVGGAWTDALSQLAGAHVSLTEVTLTDLTRLDAAVGSASMSRAGTRVGSQLPNQVAMVSSYKINVRYRGGHPRTYWPFGVAGDITNGRTWTGPFLTLAQGAVVDYIGNINSIAVGTGNLIFCAVSFYSGKDPVTGLPQLRDIPVNYTINTAAVHPRVDTMRSRLGRETA